MCVWKMSWPRASNFKKQNVFQKSICTRNEMLFSARQHPKRNDRFSGSQQLNFSSAFFYCECILGLQTNVVDIVHKKRTILALMQSFKNR